MKIFFWSLFICIGTSCYVQGQIPSVGSYAYPDLSSMDNLSAYLSTPSMRLPFSSSVKTDLPVTGFFVTVYETSPGLKQLLYVTSHFQFQEGGKTKVQDIAGPTGSKLGSRNGQAAFLSKGKDLLVFLHKDDAFAQDFTNVLQILSEETGEILTTQGDQYLKGYVRIEKKPTATSPTN